MTVDVLIAVLLAAAILLTTPGLTIWRQVVALVCWSLILALVSLQ